MTIVLTLFLLVSVPCACVLSGITWKFGPHIGAPDRLALHISLASCLLLIVMALRMLWGML
jgi:hypothetical protein